MINPLWGKGNIVNTYELCGDTALEYNQGQEAFACNVFLYRDEEG